MLQLAPEAQAREDAWREQLKLSAARYVWPRRKQKTPKSLKELQGDSPRYVLVKTWKRWWEEKFNDDYDEYLKRIADGRSEAGTGNDPGAG
jgi:hypothetical protein